MLRYLLPSGFILCLATLLALPATAPAEEPAQAVRQAVQPPPPPPPRAEDELVERVRRAIDDGVRFLKNQQSKTTGNWEGIVLPLLDMEGGVTALATLALLNCGLRVDDPTVKKALDYLETLQPRKTYVVGLQTMVFAETRQKKYQPLIQKNAEWLIAKGIGWRVNDQSKVVGGQLEGWSYPGHDLADNSNTQYALLGLYAAKTAEAKIDDTVWKAILEFYTRSQQAAGPTAGYWGYYNNKAFDGDRASFSMTVAGVCGLLIAAMGLDQSEQQLDPATGVAANCGAYTENAALHKGMNWIGAHFNFESMKSSFYNIYGIERLGRLSGQRFIDKFDWYRDGCDRLVKMQENGGANAGAIVSKNAGIDSSPVITTSFALLFLSKGRTPVLISKFAWGDFQNTGKGTFVEVPTGAKGQVNWNRKHNDTRHLVEFCSKELFNGAPLSWQVYDARRLDFGNDGRAGGRTGKEKILEEVGTLLQSPLLYINGHGPIGGRGGLTEAQKEIVKTYVEEGGFILAEACCGDKEFNESFKALMKELFPDKDKPFIKMAPEHAIWSMFPGITPKDFPEIEVMERGCRTVCVFSPIPLAGYWEEAKYMPADGKNPANRGEKAYCFARNVIAYATGMELPKPKLTRQQIVTKGSEAGVTRSHFKAAQLRLEGQEPPAPDALKNLMGYLRDYARLEVALNSVVIPPEDPQVFTFKFNYIHGRKPLNFNELQIENLQSNLNTGGLLFADAACNGFEQWKAFDKSFREMCAKLFPDKKLELIQVRGGDGKEDPLFKLARETGINILSVKCRRETADGKGPEKEMRDSHVILEGIKVDGRWVVIYSKYDIGCAIEGHKAADCLGHDKDSALRIASAVVLYSLKR
jgi:hypothetical protein